MMDKKQMETSLEGIRHLLSHLHGEVTALETTYSQLLHVLQRFEGQADLDDLTGLLRRRAFFRQWNALLDECARMNESCGVLMIDIDHFKRVNDTHGHATGDEVIKRVAGLLKQYQSPNCFPCRLGGEEFAVAVRGTEAEMMGIAEFIRRGAERLHGPVMGGDSNSSNVEWKCTVSVGVSTSQKTGYDPSKLLKAADEALYAAKNKGRNQVRAA